MQDALHWFNTWVFSSPQTVSAWAIAVGTVVLAAATLRLCREVRLSREAESSFRERDYVAQGIEPFVGRYAEKGRAPHKRNDKPGDRYIGALLEVNFWGAYFLVPGIGEFAGGMIEVQHDYLVFSMGTITNEENQVRVATARLERTGMVSTHRLLSQRIGVPWPEDQVDWSDWTLKLFEHADGEERILKECFLTKADTRPPRRAWRSFATWGRSFRDADERGDRGVLRG